MKSFLLLICLCSPLLAMELEMEQFASPQSQLRREPAPLISQSDNLQISIFKEEYEQFCEAFSMLDVKTYHEVIKLLKGYLEENLEGHKEFVHKCYSFMASFLRNQEKPEEMEEDLFSSTELLNSDSFEELRQLLIYDPYESEASIEPGSDSEEEWHN
jgi:hypothetical protein